MNKFHIEVGEEHVVAQGENTGWGNYQFPGLFYTKSGSLYALWQMRPDTCEAYQGKGYGEAVSDDMGVTWRERRESDIVLAGVPLKNGKQFKGFSRQFLFSADYMKNYTPVVEYKNYKFYFLEDIKEYEDKVEGVEIDVNSGAETTFEAKLIWNNLSLVQFPDGKILPTVYQLAVCGSAPKIILRLSDGLYFASYHRSFDIHAKNREDAIKPSFLDFSVFIFRSTDEARTWECISEITADESIYNTEEGYEGLDEPQMELMADGSVVILMRTGSWHPSYIARSTDNCRTWSKPKQFDRIGVFPQIKRLGCGVTLASYGRPGLFVRATDDESGQVWQDPIEIKLSESGTPLWDRSCSYTDLLPIDDYSAWLIYSDFYHPDVHTGKPQKSIIVRKLTVVKE